MEYLFLIGDIDGYEEIHTHDVRPEEWVTECMSWEWDECRCEWEYDEYPYPRILCIRIVTDLAECRYEDEDIDEDCRDDSVWDSVDICDDETQYCKYDRDDIHSRDMYLRYEEPTYHSTDSSCNRTNYRSQAGCIETTRWYEDICIDAREYRTDAEAKCMWNHSTMEYMIDIWDESYEVEHRSEYGKKYLKRIHSCILTQS